MFSPLPLSSPSLSARGVLVLYNYLPETCSDASFGSDLLRRSQHSLQYFRVSGAAADIPAEFVPELFLSSIRVLI